MSNLLSSLILKKSDCEGIPLVALYKIVTLGKSLLSLLTKERCKRIALFRSQNNERVDQKKCFIMFLTVISLFFPLLSPRANCPCCSSLWCSLQKSVCEQIAPITLYKRSSMSDSLFSKSESLFRSFAHKKRAIRLKNQRADSQPCFLLTITT